MANRTILYFVLWFLASSAWAQGPTPESGFLESFDVGVVDLDVTVTDSAGEPPCEEAALPLRKSRRRKALVRRARRGYREALAALASGLPPAKVAEDLARVESEIFENGSAPSSFAAHEIEIDMARKVGRIDTEALLPITLLHMELFERFGDHRAFYLAKLARQASSALALELAESSPRPAAEILLCLAATTTLRVESLRLLEEARRLAAHHDAVALAAAAAFELEGLYREALEVSDELVSRNPGNAEGRLRLAVNLERLGRFSEGEEHFRLLLESQPPDWVLAVAYQQLARRWWHDGRREEAVRLLREAVVRLPEPGRLRLQLAWFLDQGGESARVRELLGSVGPVGEDSSRHRYIGERDFEEIRRSLVEQGRLRTRALSRAFKGAFGDDPSVP